MRYYFPLGFLLRPCTPCLVLSAPFAHILVVVVFVVHITVLRFVRLDSKGIILIAVPPAPLFASPQCVPNVVLPLPILLPIIFDSVRIPHDLLKLLGIVLALH